MHKFLIALPLFAVLAPAAYAADCGSTANDQWMSEEALKAKAAEMGFDVRSIDEEDGCYEVYAMNATGERVEVYFNPVTAEIVKQKVDGEESGDSEESNN